MSIPSKNWDRLDLRDVPTCSKVLRRGWIFTELDWLLHGRQASRGDPDLRARADALSLDPAILKDTGKRSLADLGQLRYQDPISCAKVLHDLAMRCADP